MVLYKQAIDVQRDSLLLLFKYNDKDSAVILYFDLKHIELL